MLPLLFGITAGVVLVDQITKYLAFRHEQDFVLVDRLIKIVHAKNEGIAFGLGGGMKYGAVLWAALSILTVSLLLYFFLKCARRRRIDAIAFGLIIGGALGNLVDRVTTNGKVLDFIKLTFINWPAFNIADAAIVIGVVFMVFAIAFDHAEKTNGNDSGPSDRLRRRETR